MFFDFVVDLIVIQDKFIYLSDTAAVKIAPRSMLIMVCELRVRRSR
jgi:hypothetical protein